MDKRSPTKRILINTLFSIILLFIGIWGCQKAFSASYTYTCNIIENEAAKESSQTVSVLNLTITEQTTLQDLAQQLYDAHFIVSIPYFKIEVKLSDYSSELLPGSYSISSNMSTHEILNLVSTSAKSQVETVQFTIPEGYTVEQIASTLEQQGIVSKEDFLTAVNEKDYSQSFSFLSTIGYKENCRYKLEGYLFPDTYIVRKETTPEEIITKMLTRFQEIMGRYTTHLSTSGYSIDEVITIASIIEREARLEEERDMISGVIYNRLDSNMKLQMCSTIQYILEKNKANLTYADLAIESPYNTYLYEGLPAGPICAPGEASIQAALLPKTHDYYYFVLEDASTGKHYFSSTSDEHSWAKQHFTQTKDINFYE